MKRFIHTLLFSLRLSAKAPTNTLLCIFVLASGIAIVSSMFRVCQIVLYCEVPYDHSERIVEPCKLDQNKATDSGWSLNSYKMFVKEQTAFSDTIAFFGRRASVQIDGKGKQIQSTYVSTNFSEFTGIKPVMGRALIEDDALSASERVVVINERCWQSLYGSSPDVLGKTMVLDGVTRTIVGVMPASFDGPVPLSGVQIWIPLNTDTLTHDTGWGNYVSFLAKIREDVPPDVALEQTKALTNKIVEAYPYENRNTTGVSFKYINANLFNDTTRAIFSALAVCAILILFMACGIVSGLMTARYASRTQEFAIRTSLGATRFQIVSQMILEFFVISGSATILGILLTRWVSLSVLNHYFNEFGFPAYMQEEKPLTTLIFCLIVFVVVTVSSTIMPAIRASKTDLASILRESTRTGSSLRVTRLSNILIVWQVATAGAVLCGGALVGYMIHEFSTQNNYYNPDEYMCASISFNPIDYSDVPERIRLIERITQEFERYPEIEKFGLSMEFFNNYGSGTEIWIDGVDYPNREDVPTASMRIVSTGYFAATNVPLISGREFDKTDYAARKQIAVVTDAFARKYFGTIDVIGKRFKIFEKGEYLTIVGVSPDIFDSDGTQQRPVGFFVPYCAAAWNDVCFFAKSRDKNAQLEQLIAKIVNDVDSKICVSDIMTISEYRERNGGGLYMKFLFTLFSAFAVSALVMAAAGLYGIISFSVNMKRKDMGIRLALGATPAQVVTMIARAGVINSAIGMVVAAIGTIFIRQLILTEFNQVMPSADNWLIYVLSALILTSVAAISILLPAIRCASEEPSSCLREG